MLIGLHLFFTDIFVASSIIAIVTFGLSFIAVYIGEKLGSLLESKAEILGGVILIGLGCKILFEHLWILIDENSTPP